MGRPHRWEVLTTLSVPEPAATELALGVLASLSFPHTVVGSLYFELDPHKSRNILSPQPWLDPQQQWPLGVQCSKQWQPSNLPKPHEAFTKQALAPRGRRLLSLHHRQCHRQHFQLPKNPNSRACSACWRSGYVRAAPAVCVQRWLLASTARRPGRILRHGSSVRRGCRSAPRLRCAARRYPGVEGDGRGRAGGVGKR